MHTTEIIVSIWNIWKEKIDVDRDKVGIHLVAAESEWDE